MNYQLSDEQTMMLDSLRAFLAAEVYPYEAEADRAGEVPVELGKQIKAKAIEMGFYAANLPESVGGGGLVAYPGRRCDRRDSNGDYPLPGYGAGLSRH